MIVCEIKYCETNVSDVSDGYFAIIVDLNG